MSKRETNWDETMNQLVQGDRVSVAKVSHVVTCFLARYGAYNMRESWDDLCQEVLMALVRRAQKGQVCNPSAFISYVGKVTRSKLIDRIDRDRRAGATTATIDGAAAEVLRARLNPERDNPDCDIHLDLQIALSKLPERTRHVLEVIYLEGHRYEDAAQVLEMPLGTIKRLQTAGLRELRQLLGVELTATVNVRKAA